MKRRKNSLIALLFICSALQVVVWSGMVSAEPGQKQQLQRLTISGSKHFSQSKLRAWFDLAEGSWVDRTSVRSRGKSLLERLQKEGFYFASIDSIFFSYSQDSSKVDIVVHLNEAMKTIVADYEIRGMPEISDLPVIRFDLQEGHVFLPDALTNDIEAILQALEGVGFPFAKVAIAEVAAIDSGQRCPDSVRVALRVEPGDRTIISEIDLIGNTHTKANTILRELPVAEGDVYTQEQVDKIQSRLLNLGFFRWVNPPRLELLKRGQARLILEVAEGNHNRFDGVVGYNPATQASSGFVTGLLDFKFGNLFGTGRQLAARWERRSKETQAFQFSYMEPWIAGVPLQGSFGFKQLIQDTSYIERDIGLTFDYRLNESLRINAGASRSKVAPDSIGAIRLGIEPSTALNFTVGVTVGSLDNPINPSRGLLYSTSFKFSRKQLGLSDADSTMARGDFDQKHLSVDLESYLPLFQWQVFAVGVHGREVRSGEPVIPIPDQYRFGGTQSLRGYREEQLRGVRVAWANIEYRYLLGARSRFFGFWDLGYFLRKDLAGDILAETENIKFGFGFGARIETRLGLVGLDYGLGEGDNFTNGKVHVSLTNEF